MPLWSAQDESHINADAHSDPGIFLFDMTEYLKKPYKTWDGKIKK